MRFDLSFLASQYWMPLQHCLDLAWADKKTSECVVKESPVRSCLFGHGELTLMRSCSRASPQGAHEHVCEPLSEHSSSKQGVDEKLLKILKCERQSNTITPGDNFGSECTAGPGLRQKRCWRWLRVFPGAHPQKYPDGGSR